MLVIILSVLAAVITATLIAAYICYRITFLNIRHSNNTTDEFPVAKGRIYEPFRERMIELMKEARQFPYTEAEVMSFDGLRLCGKYYEYKKGAPIELMFHGYRGNSERDLCGGIQRAFRLGMNVLLVDQRATGKSEGKVITFGIHESRDVLTWIDYILTEISADAQIVLTGISMGGATVLNAAGRKLPKNVVYVLADCSFSSAKEIIKKVIADRGMSPKIMYPFVKLGARIFGHFSITETSPVDAMKRCNVPVIFIHGEADRYVPCDMSRKVFDACHTCKSLYTVKNAGHGLSYLVDTEGYFRALETFCKQNGLA